MISFFSTPRLQELLPIIKNFMEEEIYPHELDYLKMPFFQVEKILREKKKKIQDMGVWNLYMNESHGGPGLSLVEVAQISEVLGGSFFGHFSFNCQAPDAGNIELLIECASDEIKSKYLPSLLKGETRSCFSMTEPHTAGSNPLLLDTTAKKDGNEYIINGRKWFTTSADGADFAIVMCKTSNNNENPYQRASMILVPVETKGFNIIRNIPIMGHAGEGWMSHSEIEYNDVRVPISNILGNEGEGFILAQKRLGPGRIHHCMRWIGIAERCFDLMCKRAASREIDLNGRKLGHKQMVQNMIAESRAEIDAARLMVLEAAHLLETQGSKAATVKISTIKFFASNMLNKVIDRAIQIHGALGITDDTIISYFYREERGAKIYDGTDETHKSSVAKKILKKQYGMK